MKKIILSIAAIIIAVSLIYSINNKKTVNQTDPIEKIETDSLLTKEDNTTKQKSSINIQNIKGVQPKNHIEQLWFENDRNIPVSSYMEELFSEVENRNPLAQFQLAFIHQICFNAPENEQQLNHKLDLIKSENSQQRLVERFVFCEGYSRNKIAMKDIGILIKEAARAGHPVAKREFIKYAFQDITPENMVDNAELITDLKHESFQHLLDARNMGDSDSLLSLGMAYEGGQVIEQNNIEAYAYYYAYNTFKPGSSDTLLRMLEENLTREETDLAIEKGEYYAQCCN